MSFTTQLLSLASFTVVFTAIHQPVEAAELKGAVFISEATQAATREYALCVRASAKLNYARLRETMFAGAWTAGQAAMIGSGICKVRWEAYEGSTAADYRLAGVPLRAPAPILRDAIDAQIADQLLESEREVVALCNVQIKKHAPVRPLNSEKQ